MYSILMSILLLTFRAQMVGTTFGTQVAIPALRGALVAYTIVPLTACFSGSAIWSSNLFIFVRTAVVLCAIILEVPGFKMTELAELRGSDKLNLSCVSADGLIEVDHLCV